MIPKEGLKDTNQKGVEWGTRLVVTSYGGRKIDTCSEERGEVLREMLSVCGYFLSIYFYREGVVTGGAKAQENTPVPFWRRKKTLGTTKSHMRAAQSTVARLCLL